MDEILAFQRATGVGLVWDLNAALRESATSPWNFTNAAAMLEFFNAAPARGLPVPVAFQCGNEPEDWYKRSPPINISGPTLAADFHALRGLLRAFPSLAGAAIYGPSACCEDRFSLLPSFIGPVVGALDALDVHAYPLPRGANDSCVPAAYTNKSAMLGVAAAVAGYKVMGAPLLSQGIPLFLGETATSAHGGCNGLSNTFVSGFTFMLELGTLGELGVAQINRQDIAGFSSATGPSNYALLGPPGWHGAGVPIGQPHPDYWIALLWKQLIGRRVLKSTLSSPEAPLLVQENVDLHVWCSAEGGHAVLTFFAMEAQGPLLLPSGFSSTPRTEYILTSPGTLYTDGVLLNGELLETLASGQLKAWPVPGSKINSGGGDFIFRPWSYGFIILEGIAAPSCA